MMISDAILADNAIFKPNLVVNIDGIACDPKELSTVSFGLVSDLLASLQTICPHDQYSAILEQAGIVSALMHQPAPRVTYEQLVMLYQLAAVQTGDEMMGLWSRPVRRGTLKYLCMTLLNAPGLGVALYRFTQFWNLILDDYALHLDQDDTGLRVSLRPHTQAVQTNRFGHLLMLKLVHGVASWLAGRELPVRGAAFAFARPDFADDYPVLLPAPVSFDARYSSLWLEPMAVALPRTRNQESLNRFLQRAPRDWLFTGNREHALQLKVREYLRQADGLKRSLHDTARHMHVSARTLIRRLRQENQSFQGIKDNLRRDMAIRSLGQTAEKLEDIAQTLGFSSVEVFHRAFKTWTGMTPAAYRQARTGVRRYRRPAHDSARP